MLYISSVTGLKAVTLPCVKGVIFTEENISGRISSLEANEKNIFHQLDEIKLDVRDIQRLTAAVERMALQMQSTAERVGSIDKRLAFVEQAPAEDMRYYRRTAVCCALSGIIGTLLGAISALFLK